MAEKKLNIAYYNGVWVLLEGLTVHRLGTKYEKSGNYIVGTNPDGTRFAVYVGGEKIRKYGVFTKFFPVGEDRMAVWEIDGKWKLYTRTGVKVILGDMVDESGRFFVYKCPEGVKFSRREGTRLTIMWCKDYRRGLNKSITLYYFDGMSELIAV